jgi:hypothetical protein
MIWLPMLPLIPAFASFFSTDPPPSLPVRLAARRAMHVAYAENMHGQRRTALLSERTLASIPLA